MYVPGSANHGTENPALMHCCVILSDFTTHVVLKALPIILLVSQNCVCLHSGSLFYQCWYDELANLNLGIL